MNGMQTAALFDQLLKMPNEPIYVVNNTSPRSRVTLTLTEAKSGKSEFAAIPKTYIPINITLLFTRDMLDSYDLRKYFLKGILTIMPKEKAEKVLATKDAQDEMNRISSSMYANPNNETAAMRALREAEKDVEKANREADTEAIGDEEDAINDTVRDLILQLEEKTIKSKEALTQLKSMKKDLTEDDLNYILHSVQSENIKAWVKEKLAERITNVKVNKKNSAKDAS